MSLVCKECHSYQLFKDKCWFFWEGKRACSQFRTSPAAEPSFFATDELAQLLRRKP